MSDELSLRGIIHDLSNALTVILGWAEEARGKDDATRTHALGIIEERARSAHVLARRAIGVNMGRDVATVSALCSKLGESLQVAAERQHVALTIDVRGCADQEVDSAADFEQVIQNLLFNAFEHAPQNTAVQLALEASATHFEVRVQDQGSGVPEALRADLFGGHSTREGGTGLGLLHSRRMAEAHGGSLDLDTSVSGAAFVLRWGRGRPTPSSEGLVGAHVIVVEDDDAIADLISLGLEARGAHVARARTLVELERCLTPECAAVILDWSPVTADPAAWHAAVGRLAPRARLVVVTGQPERVTLEGVRLLAKPFEVKELLAVLLDS